MKHATISIQAGIFKAKCLQLMDDVQTKQLHIVITKHGKPVAQLIPLEEEPRLFFGCLSHTVSIEQDLLTPLDERWEANE